MRKDYRPDRTGQLWLDEGGAGNDFTDIYIRDEKNGNDRRPLSEAQAAPAKALGQCNGRMPWLGMRSYEKCDKVVRLLTRSASNAYFAQTLAAIAIPDAAAKLKRGLDEVWDIVKTADNVEELRFFRKKFEKVVAALEGWSDEAVWAEIARRRKGQAPARKSIKQAEIETLLSQPATSGEDDPDGDFFARTKSLDGLKDPFRHRIDRVVLVHRLREVVAQIGFTRFEPKIPDFEGELSIDIERAPIARELSWLPACENQGEGFFLSFPADAIREWLKRKPVRDRGAQLLRGLHAWAARRNLAPQLPFEQSLLPYCLLHSLSHLLVTAVSLECGYAATSIRERIYAGDSGYGILLYTGSSGSEGTLGGLVDVGRNIRQHLERALEIGRLCSNDPVCAQHVAEDPHEERFLHGAACHGCLLIAETCCERRNEMLDRALVVPTVASSSAAFFPEEP